MCAYLASALVASASLKLLPHATVGAAAAGMLSADGRCKTFDARANGYVRSEAVGALVVWAAEGGSGVAQASLGGSAVRQDGRSASLTAPNGQAQRDLLSRAHAVSGAGLAERRARAVRLEEAPLGDPVEAC